MPKSCLFLGGYIGLWVQSVLLHRDRCSVSHCHIDVLLCDLVSFPGVVCINRGRRALSSIELLSLPNQQGEILVLLFILCCFPSWGLSVWGFSRIMSLIFSLKNYFLTSLSFYSVAFTLNYFEALDISSCVIKRNYTFLSLNLLDHYII